MTLDEISGRLDAIMARVRRRNTYAFACFIVSPAGSGYSLVVNGDRPIFKGDGTDPAALFAAARDALDATDPDMLARTLGIEPAPAQAAE